MKPAAYHSANARIRVLIGDDHVVVREGLAAMIGRQEDMTVVAEAADGISAVEAWTVYRPDITLLDLRMPLLDGLGALRAIREKNQAARIIVFTTFDTDNDISMAVKSGAKAYLIKDTLRDDLLACIRCVHAGETCIPAPVLAKLADSIGHQNLTNRELEVLGRLVKGESNKEIGASLYIGETTVKSHLRNIFTKLNVFSRTEVIAEAIKRGLINL